MKAKLPCHFKVWTERKRTHYYTVYIFPDRESMRQFYRDLRHNVLGKSHGPHTHFEAMCCPWRRLRNGRPTKDMGVILFYIDFIGAGIVSHEMTHAALEWWHWYMRRSHESIATVNGNLVGQFWKQFYKRKLGKEGARS